MLKKLTENWKEIKRSSARTDISRKLWCNFCYDRTEPTLKLHDNTSFIELNSKDIKALRAFLVQLDDEES